MMYCSSIEFLLWVRGDGRMMSEEKPIKHDKAMLVLDGPDVRRRRRR